MTETTRGQLEQDLDSLITWAGNHARCWSAVEHRAAHMGLKAAKDRILVKLIQMESALRTIANYGCEHPEPNGRCATRRPDNPEDWCSPCLAADALGRRP